MSLPQKLLALLTELVLKGFYGTVTLRFEAGKITTVEKKETIKIS
jgi:hypothetical protein